MQYENQGNDTIQNLFIYQVITMTKLQILDLPSVENLADSCNTLSIEELNMSGGATALAITRNGGVGYGFAAFGVAFGIGGSVGGGRLHIRTAFSLY
jgi:hypothetical protein